MQQKESYAGASRGGNAGLICVIREDRLEGRCTKSGKSDLFSLRPLRISVALCVERPINAENAEIRRGPQRKDFHPNQIFRAKTLGRALPQKSEIILGYSQYRER